jgi:hypothetical protein
MTLRRLVLPAALAVSGCGVSPQNVPPVPPVASSLAPDAPEAGGGVTGAPAGDQEAPDGADLLDSLEQRLITARAVRAEVDVEARGALAARYQGTLDYRVGDDGALALELAFAGSLEDGVDPDRAATEDLPVLGLRVAGGRVHARASERRAELRPPPALWEAMVVGLVRMGLLHNLARLSELELPDHADGQVMEWVRVREAAKSATERVDGEDAVPIRFEIEVAGQRVGEATLWLSARGHLPVRRVQQVRFANGTMDVTERYRGFVVHSR